MTDIVRLQKALGYEFKNPQLLTLALTHRSAGGQSNERLEFLGDSILNHIIAESLYQRFPRSHEGVMSRMRASLVKGETLADIATELALGEYLLLGSGERKSGGHRRRSILADTLEALIGSILLDTDVETCRSWVLRLYHTRLDNLDPDTAEKDAKTSLQEYVQGRGNPLPQYSLLGVAGDDHTQHFKIQCHLQKPDLTVEGEGSSRRKAEQKAAAAALSELIQHDTK